MRISDWSSDVFSSDLEASPANLAERLLAIGARLGRLSAEVYRGELGIQTQQLILMFDLAGCQIEHPAEHALRIGETVATELGQVEIGRASCRERGCQYVWISVFAVSL